MTVPEQWRPVVGYEDLYEVSDLGRVRSLDRILRTSNGRVYLWRGRLLAPAPHKTDGRLRVALCGNGPQRDRVVYQLVLEAFIGPRPPGTEACHNDGDCSNNRLSNLRWDTRSSNIRDAIAHGVHSNASKQLCSRGHRLAEPNLVKSMAAHGYRSCLACNRAHSKTYQAKRSGRPHDMDAWADDHYARIMAA